MRKFLSRLKDIFYGSLSTLLFLAIWEILPRIGVLNQAVTPPPSKVVVALWQVVSSGKLTIHVLFSLQRAGLGFLLALAVAVPLGFLLGTYIKAFDRVLIPFLRWLEKLNPFALIPVFILFFGIGETCKVAIIFWVAQWPLLFNTIAGTKEIDPLLIKSARSMGASRSVIFFRVVLPAAVPNIFTGVKIGAQVSFFMVVAAEMIGASKGLGWMIMNAESSYKIPLMFGVMITISVLGVAIHSIFSKLERHFLVWKESAFGASEA